jgi:hypothetical protein
MSDEGNATPAVVKEAVKEATAPDKSGQWTVFAMLAALNVLGLFVVLSSKTYVEETVMSQVANTVSRTNGLLSLVIFDLVALAGIVLFRR